MIELKQICFTYADGADGGLKDIDLTVKSGECILLCGRSGCGKTTITRLINGLIPGFFSGELEGDVTINNESILGVPMYKISSHVGSVFQNPRTQFFNVDTDSEIAFGIENEAVPPEELNQRLENVTDVLHINSLRERNIFELSGGEKQKIAFASVYAMNPDIYLLDEPSSNLDMSAIGELKEHLRLIKAQGKTILIAEHRLYYLMDIADRIIYLEQGHITDEFVPAVFRTLPESKRKEMGLRSVDLKKEKLRKWKLALSEPILELRNVTLFYKKRMILEQISMKAAQGEVIAVVGHNGAGKTTFSRSLCGLHKDYTGDFYWKGIPINNKARLKLSYMVMQDVNYELFADSVEAECSFGIKKFDDKRVEHALKKLGLFPYRKRHPNTLSGGQKQRTAVAVSMVCNKNLLVFDEPTSGLDYDSMMRVAELIYDLASSEKIIFIVTHDYEFVCRTCSRVLYLDKGRVTEDLLINKENKHKIQTLFSIKE